MVALYTTWYNWARINLAVKVSPAMAAGLTDTLWGVDDLAKLAEGYENSLKLAPNLRLLFNGELLVEVDWRLEHLQEQSYLCGVRFKRGRWRQRQANWDHDHCVGCYGRFAELDRPDETIFHDGFTTCADYQHGAEYDWVCPECFALFKDDMGWIEAEESKL